MKTGLKQSKCAKCPYYTKHGSVRIFCHPHPDDLYSLSLWFPCREARRAYMKENCCSIDGYRECEIYAGQNG